MITKKDFCMHLIQKEGYDTPEDAVKDKGWFKSTSVGIALQYLGYLDNDDEALEYINNRGGIFILYNTVKEEDENLPRDDKYCHVMTTREMLELLPESLDK